MKKLYMPCVIKISYFRQDVVVDSTRDGFFGEDDPQWIG